MANLSNFAADFTGFGRMRYLYFLVDGSASARARWSADDGIAASTTSNLLFPDQRLVVRRVQTRIDQAVSVIGGMGTSSIRLDLTQPPTDSGSGPFILTLTDLSGGAILNDPLVDLYNDMIRTPRPQIRLQAVNTLGTPSGWAGRIRVRIGYQYVHEFNDLPDDPP